MCATAATKWVYVFSEGNAGMVNLLGGKGANLAEMAGLGLPVPPGFTITTEANSVYFDSGGRLPDDLIGQVREAMKSVEKDMGRNFGDLDNPLLISVRSGARRSMPGMMETVLNVGLCTATIPGMVKQSGNERFVYDAYRRLITMYSDVVMEKAAGIEHEDEEMAVRPQLEKLMSAMKEGKGYKLDTDLTAEDLKSLCKQYKARVKEVLGKEFPDDPWPVELSHQRVVLGSKGSREVNVLYTVPAEGVTQVCHLRATPTEDPEFSTYSTLTVLAGVAPAVRPLSMPLALEPYRHENEQFGYLPDYPVQSQ
ncbi:MAG: hypothetical protein JSV02_06840, partial [Dehalococcoidia bacterium]